MVPCVSYKNNNKNYTTTLRKMYTINQGDDNYIDYFLSE